MMKRNSIQSFAGVALLYFPSAARAEQLDIHEVVHRFPMQGSVSCVIDGKTLRLKSLSIIAKGRDSDLCAVPLSLIATEYGARAQFVWGFNGLDRGNEYSSTFYEVNCRTKEVRDALVWKFQASEPEQTDGLKRQEALHGKYSPFGSPPGIWALIPWHPLLWTKWKPITSENETHKWLCKQWKDKKE